MKNSQPMQELDQWLEARIEVLVDTASRELSQSEALRATVVESTEAFYESLLRTLRQGNPVSFHLILLDWVEARSAPTDGEPAGFMPILVTLKRVTWETICRDAPKDCVLGWLTKLEQTFSDGAAYLAKLEAEALLNDIRAELDRALMNVERLNKSKSDFIAVAAHELKTPLTLIEGYTNMIRGSFPEELYPGIGMMLSGISSGSARLRQIIQDMIDASMIEMGLLTLHFQPVWLHRLIDILEFELDNTFKQRNLVLEIDRSSLPDKPTYGDPERLFQVLYKVISNAVKYTPDGGRIALHARELPGFIEIVIEDSGIGIAAEDLHRIFEKFSSLVDISLHSSGKTKFKGGGPGLGLAIAKGIVEAHGGTIWAESPGYDESKLPGSIFHVMIPMRAAPPGDRLSELYAPTVDTADGSGHHAILEQPSDDVD